jgi:hypothetical protein
MLQSESNRPSITLQITASILCAVLAVFDTGCALPTGILKSRWAMSDPEYAEKYCDGAEKSDVVGKLKQAIDARFQEDASGLFVSGGYAKRADADHGLFAIDVGGEAYMTSYLTGRVSLMGMGNGEDWFTGADTGLRLQTPTRLAPFVGAGVFAGYAHETVSADDDWKDNDDDGRIDEFGEEDERISGTLAAVYPELGGHFWWTPQVRLTSYGRYMITTEGSDANDWQFGFGLALFTNPGLK